MSLFFIFLTFLKYFIVYRYLSIYLYIMNSIYKALTDENRRKILELLKEKDMSVNEIVKHFNISQASISHHLDILKRANLVSLEKKWQFVFYSLNVSVFEEFVKWLFDFIKKD